MDLEGAKRVGIAAAYQSAKSIMSHYGRLTNVQKKGPIDLVTEADQASENVIIDTIRAAFPQHAILSEESGWQEGNDNWQWIIDPLDGTTNFAHQVDLFAISIAFAEKGTLRVGIILNPVSGELFTAVKGQGAQLNGRPIAVSKTSVIADSLLVTGFPYSITAQLPIAVPQFINCLKASQGVRRLGSAALDLCFVACGRFEGFWETGLNSWDTAAGFLIAEEAGARVTDFAGDRFDIQKKEILATNGYIHAAMLQLLQVEEMQCELI
ncbi:MAG: inositol monophosphatase family protein [Desulfobacterales bacterium]|nr:inositol monophosphatase family protein [Desulfobacterales bacterium]